MLKKNWDSLQKQFDKTLFNKQYDKAEELIKRMQQVVEEYNRDTDQLNLLFNQAELSRQIDESTQAEKYLQEAATEAKNKKQYSVMFQAFDKLDQLMNETNQNKKRHAYLEKATQLASKLHDIKRRNKILVKLANAYFTSGQFDQADSTYQRILEIGEDDQNDYMKMKGLAGLSRVYLQKGAVPKAKETIDQAMRYAEKQQDLDDQIRLQINKAGIFAYEFDYAESMKQYKEILKQVRKHNFKREELVCTINLGILSNYMGLYDDARYYLQEVRDGLKEYHDKGLEISLLQAEARYYINTGNMRSGLELLGKAGYYCMKHDYNLHAVDIYLDRAYLYCFLDRWKQAEVDVETAFELGEKLNYYILEIRGRIARACLRIVEGEVEEGSEIVNSILAKSYDSKFKIPLAPAAELVGYTFHYINKKEFAKAYYKRAKELYEEIHVPKSAKRCEYYLSTGTPSKT
jgi:tetratricopeptide (TPR) repeat protein